MRKDSLLWEIKPGYSSPSSFLYGTMHVQDQRVFRLSDQLKDLIQNCEAFATEIDLTQKAPQVNPQSLLIPNNETLLDYLPEKKFSKLQKIILKAFEIDLHLFLRTLPILTVNELTNRILTQDQHLNLDAYLSEFAHTIGRQMYGIETLEEHLQILQRIPIAYQVDNLKLVGRNVTKYRKLILRWVQLYEQGQSQKLYLASRRSLGKLKKLMLYDRNAIMANRIIKLMQSHTLFCAIGAAHLPGEQGVIRMLQQKGYTLKPVFVSL